MAGALHTRASCPSNALAAGGGSEKASSFPPGLPLNPFKGNPGNFPQETPAFHKEATLPMPLLGEGLASDTDGGVMSVPGPSQVQNYILMLLFLILNILAFCYLSFSPVVLVFYPYPEYAWQSFRFIL